MGIISETRYRLAVRWRQLLSPLRRVALWFNRIRHFDEVFARHEPRYRWSGSEYEQKDFSAAKSDTACKVIAFYLPQYHRFALNDRTWGYGFTEWENVARAVPVARGHYQPKLPGEFGFYDLNNAEIHYKQVETAREAGLHAFCYHHYWFDPEILMDMAVERHLQSIDFPFMVCWANEAWSKRWDGSENEIVMPQDYKPGCATRAAEYFSRYFQSSKYVRIEGRPVFIIYRTDKIPGLPDFIGEFSAAVERAIGVRPFLINALSFGSPLTDGTLFDKSVYFPPHGAGAGVIPMYSPRRKTFFPKMLRKFEGLIYRYEDLIWQQPACYEKSGAAAFPTVCPGWDNTARKPNDGHIFFGETVPLFDRWLQKATGHLHAKFPPQERLLFVNAWNEWAEGAYLEPDRVRGYAFLNALSRYCGK